MSEDEIFSKYLEDVFAIIDRGYWKTPKLQKGWLYLYNDSGESERINLQIFNEEDQKEIHRQAKEYARRVRQQMKEKVKRQEQQEERRQVVGTGRRYTLEMLDKSHAKIVRNLTETTGWFADVLHEIGFYATIIAMQHAKVPPEQLYEQVVKFKDPSEFSSYVKDHLTALLEATEDAKVLTELRSQLDLMDAKLLLLKEAYHRLKNQRDELTMMLHTATASMCDSCMKRFILSWMSVKYGLSVRGGVNGGTVSEDSSKEERDTGGGGEAFT